MNARDAYNELLRRYAECKDLAGAAALMSWDQETYMPPGGAAARANQRATLAGIHHGRFTDPKIADLLQTCESKPGEFEEEELAAIREFRLDYDEAVLIPGDLVMEFAAATSAALQVWKETRPRSDFAGFCPSLQKVVDLARRKAEALSQGRGNTYDALLNIYERGSTAESLTKIFGELRRDLAPLVVQVLERNAAVDASHLQGEFDNAAQVRLGLAVIRAMGFDLESGRVDPSAHPFCSSMGQGDTRLTRRTIPGDLRPALFGMMHEAGHGLYEQGLPVRWARHPLGEAVSLGIHESQSRLWENIVGRSKPFWEFALPLLRENFPSRFQNTKVEEIYRAANEVSASFIRVEADELTYNLHVILRFELERDLFADAVAVDDIPSRWNEGMRDLLGIVPANDGAGCMQDIHWPMGGFGYFPTYTLGNLYGAQFYQAAHQALPDLDDQFRLGSFAELRDWLRQNLHQHGRRFSAEELVLRVTGSPLSHKPLMQYLRKKMADIYNID